MRAEARINNTQRTAPSAAAPESCTSNPETSPARSACGSSEEIEPRRASVGVTYHRRSKT